MDREDLKYIEAGELGFTEENIEEEFSFDQLKIWEKELFQYLAKNQIYPEDGTFSNNRAGFKNIIELTLRIDGDWKHDHLFTEHLVENFAKEKQWYMINRSEESIGESDSDWYESVHTWIFEVSSSVDLKESLPSDSAYPLERVKELAERADGGADFSEIKDNGSNYELDIRYWGNWEVSDDDRYDPDNEDEEFEDWDWKQLTPESTKRFQEIIDRVSKEENCTFNWHTGEKEYIEVYLNKPVKESFEKLNETKYDVTFHDGPQSNRKTSITIEADSEEEAERKIYNRPEARQYDNVVWGEHIEGVTGYAIAFNDEYYWNGQPDKHAVPYDNRIVVKAENESQARRFYIKHLYGKFHKLQNTENVFDKPLEQGQSMRFGSVIEIYQTMTNPEYVDRIKLDATNESLDEEIELDETYSDEELDDMVGKAYNQQRILNIYRRQKYGDTKLYAHTRCTECGREKKVFLSNLVNDPDKYGSCVCSDANIDSKIDRATDLYDGSLTLPNNTSGHTGVSFVKTYKGEPYNKWRAYIDQDGKRTYLGDFDKKRDAIKHREEAAKNGIRWYKLNKSKVKRSTRGKYKRTRKLRGNAKKRG